MITAKIQIPEHLKEYCIGKFNNLEDTPVRFPDKLDLYHTIYDLAERRPANCQVDRGNFEIILPDRGIGKKPETYNYLGIRSQDIIARKIDLMMWAEVHDFLDEQKHRFGINYIVGVHAFMRKYDINAISEDAFLKNFYRWRDHVRHKSKKRDYNRKINEL